MKQEIKDKIRDSHFKRCYGENYEIEDVEEHRKEMNTKHLKTWRNKHREHYRDYQLEYQRKYRERNKFYYGWKHAVEKNPDLTLEEYIDYRNEKLKKKMAKSIKSKK